MSENSLEKMMLFVRKKHAGQVRKYTGEPYTNHLHEVAAVAMSAYGNPFDPHLYFAGVIGMGHDLIEDTDTTHEEIADMFGLTVADSILALTDQEMGNRAERKLKSAVRLAAANGLVQTVKLADLISNTSSIVTHDPNFAMVYLKEKKMLLEVLTRGSRTLHRIASEQVEDGLRRIGVSL